jgi:hypothetical protein
MRKKLQVVLTDEAATHLEKVLAEASDGFINGSINCSDLVNEMILSAKVDIKALQAKHTNLRKSLRVLAAQKDIDLESAIKALTEMKSRTAKRGTRSTSPPEEVEE